MKRRLPVDDPVNFKFPPMITALKAIHETAVASHCLHAIGQFPLLQIFTDNIGGRLWRVTSFGVENFKFSISLVSAARSSSQ
jgi:hypothetical protein